MRVRELLLAAGKLALEQFSGVPITPAIEAAASQEGDLHQT
jgi:hypothetical protein